MINRTGNVTSPPSSVTPQDDPITKIITAILKGKPQIQIREVKESGDVIFSVDLQPLGVKESDLKRSAFLRTTANANFIGEFLLYQNFDKFLELLVTEPNYDAMVKKFQHQHFGMARQGAMLVFTFHLSKIFDLINSDLAKLLTGTE